MKKFNNIILYQLLHIIKYNGNIKKLTREGISYIEIVDNIKSLIEENKIISLDNKIQLTENGEQLFNELSSNYKNKDKDKWIEKELSSKIEKLDINFIFLPNQNELYF